MRSDFHNLTVSQQLRKFAQTLRHLIRFQVELSLARLNSTPVSASVSLFTVN